MSESNFTQLITQLFTITKNTKYNTTKSFYFFTFLLEANFSVGGGFEKWCLVDQILAVHFSSINLERERNSLQMIGNFLGDVQMSLVQVPFVSSTEIFELSAKTLNEHRSVGSTASANKTFDSGPQGDDVTELRFNQLILSLQVDLLPERPALHSAL